MGLVLGNKVTGRVLALVVSLTGPALFAAEPRAAATTSPAPVPPRRLIHEYRQPLYELRVMQASPGKLDALKARIRDHQIPIMEQHGLTTLAVFVPAGENPNALVLLVFVANALGGMVEGLEGLREDPKWLDVMAETDKDGKLLAREHRERLNTISWSPRFPPEENSQEPRVFELRTYTSPDRSKHIALLRRFREHTLKLFEKHGMENIVYWIPEGDQDNAKRLIYLLGHKSIDNAKESFAAFRQDPEWVEAKKQSEEKRGSLTAEKNGVVSEFLVATEYSPVR